MKTERALLGAGIVLLAVALIVFGYEYRYAARTSRALKEVGVYGAGNGFPKLTNEMPSVSAGESLVQQYVVSESAVPKVVSDLEARGRAQGGKMDTVSVNSSGKGADAKLLVILSIRGTFDQVMRAVAAIEYAPYALTVTSLSVTHEVGAWWHADLKISIAAPALP